VSFKVFINYRRSDCEHVAGRLYDRLEIIYSAERLFIDIDSIPKGDDFVARMKERVAEADVMLALIGPTWLKAADETGALRLDDPADPVRMELETALEGNKIIIPVTVGKAEMPRERSLPEALKPLARRNAERLTHESFAADVRRLVSSIEYAVETAQARRKAPVQRPQKVRTRFEPTGDGLPGGLLPAGHIGLPGMAAVDGSAPGSFSYSRRLLLGAGVAGLAAAGAALVFPWGGEEPAGESPPSSATQRSGGKKAGTKAN
jgi:hypothetical protein